MQAEATQLLALQLVAVLLWSAALHVPARIVLDVLAPAGVETARAPLSSFAASIVVVGCLHLCAAVARVAYVEVRRREFPPAIYALRVALVYAPAHAAHAAVAAALVALMAYSTGIWTLHRKALLNDESGDDQDDGEDASTVIPSFSASPVLVSALFTGVVFSVAYFARGAHRLEFPRMPRQKPLPQRLSTIAHAFLSVEVLSRALFCALTGTFLGVFVVGPYAASLVSEESDAVMTQTISSFFVLFCVQLAVAGSLELGETITRVILLETKKETIEGAHWISATSLCEQGSVVEAFRALKLLDITETTAIIPPTPQCGRDPSVLLARGMASRMMSMNEAMAYIQKWWSAQKPTGTFSSSSSSSDYSSYSANDLKALWNARFSAVTQALYAAEARRVGDAFARPSRNALGPAQELLRARAFLRLAREAESLAASLSRGDRIRAMESCMNVVDAQSLRVMAFTRSRMLHPEPPVNARTGLSDMDVYILPCSARTSEEERTAAAFHAQEAHERWRERAFIGGAWWDRHVLGRLSWDFDPILEERERRRWLAQGKKPRVELLAAAPPSGFLAGFSRVEDPEWGLFNELAVVENAAEALAILATSHPVPPASVVSLARNSLEHLARAVEELQRVLRASPRPVPQHCTLVMRVDFGVKTLLQHFP